MKKSGGQTALITAAMVIAGIRLWSQLRGKAKTPFNEWAIGWGAMFFTLALLSEVAPTAAGALAWIAVVSDFLQNGVSLTTDVSSIITGQEKGDTFVPQPFAPGSQSGTVQANSAHQGAQRKAA